MAFATEKSRKNFFFFFENTPDGIVSVLCGWKKFIDPCRRFFYFCLFWFSCESLRNGEIKKGGIYFKLKNFPARKISAEILLFKAAASANFFSPLIFLSKITFVSAFPHFSLKSRICVSGTIFSPLSNVGLEPMLVTEGYALPFCDIMLMKTPCGRILSLSVLRFTVGKPIFEPMPF